MTLFLKKFLLVWPTIQQHFYPHDYCLQSSVRLRFCVHECKPNEVKKRLASGAHRGNGPWSALIRPRIRLWTGLWICCCTFRPVHAPNSTKERHSAAGFTASNSSHWNQTKGIKPWSCSGVIRTSEHVCSPGSEECLTRSALCRQKECEACCSNRGDHMPQRPQVIFLSPAPRALSCFAGCLLPAGSLGYTKTAPHLLQCHLFHITAISCAIGRAMPRGSCGTLEWVVIDPQ